MTKTPWGQSEELAAGKLSPGQRLAAEEVARSQRERLFGATVALVAEQGYEAMTVGELVALSGVSRSAFYRHFADKRACFIATMKAVLAQLMDVVAPSYDGRGGALRSFLEAIAAEPAAARMFLLEAHAAGSEAQALIEETLGGLEALYARAYAERRETEQMPTELIGAVVGALRRVISVALLRGEESELAGRAEELWDWSMSYGAPPRALRRRSRAQLGPALGGSGGASGRIIAGAGNALARSGYQATTIAEIAEQAGVSLRTFYAHFSGKEAVFWAALDAGQAQMFAQALPAYRRTLTTQGWPQAIRAGCEALLDFLAGNPDFARLAFIETQSLGPRGLALRERTAETLRPFIEPGYERAPGETNRVASIAIPGAVTALINNRVQAQGAESLAGDGALATYIVLAPFTGAEEACAVARGER